MRENAESIAFFGGEASEERLLGQRLGAVIANYAQLLITSRNLQFFTSFYRCARRQLPALDLWVSSSTCSVLWLRLYIAA